MAPQPIELPKPPPAPELVSAAALAGVVGDHRGEVLACFAEGKKRNHALHGTVTVQFSVDHAGVVRRAQVQSTLGDPLVAACVAKVARAWRFPARDVGGTADVSYPFHLN